MNETRGTMPATSVQRGGLSGEDEKVVMANEEVFGAREMLLLGRHAWTQLI